MARKAKLNLTINAELKDKMRELAQNHGQSVSEITADLYSRLISGQRFLDLVYVVQAYHSSNRLPVDTREIHLFDSMDIAQQWIKIKYHYDKIDRDRLDIVRDRQGNVTTMTIYKSALVMARGISDEVTVSVMPVNSFVDACGK